MKSSESKDPYGEKMTKKFRACLFIGFILYAADAAAAPIKIRFAVSMLTIGTLPVWIAKERGFFAKEGLEVEVIAVSGGLDITSLVAGSVEFSDSVPANA